jgi:hypothetical protein
MLLLLLLLLLRRRGPWLLCWSVALRRRHAVVALPGCSEAPNDRTPAAIWSSLLLSSRACGMGEGAGEGVGSSARIAGRSPRIEALGEKTSSPSLPPSESLSSLEFPPPSMLAMVAPTTKEKAAPAICEESEAGPRFMLLSASLLRRPSREDSRDRDGLRGGALREGLLLACRAVPPASETDAAAEGAAVAMAAMAAAAMPKAALVLRDLRVDVVWRCTVLRNASMRSASSSLS